MTFHPYGLALGASALAYLCVAGVFGYRKGLRSGTVRLFGLLGLPLGLLLSRILFCIANFRYYTETISQPLRMLAFWDGGYSLLGAFCGMVLAAWIAARLAKVRFATLFDVIAVPVSIFAFGVRLAEGLTAGQLGIGRPVEAGALAQQAPLLFVQEQMGTLTLQRLAVYRYEAVVALILFAVLLIPFWRKQPKYKARQGDIGIIAFALFGTCQLLLESLRDDGHMIWGFIRVQQLGFALMPVVALLVFGSRYLHIRQGRGRVLVAWLLLPIAALVALLMVQPLNHVLDLTDKRMIGFAVLGVIGIYWGFFLRLRGLNLRMLTHWIVALVAIAGCIMVEFSIDGSSHLVRDYAMMGLCCVGLFLSPYVLWRKLTKQVYREESITVRINQPA